MLPVLLVLLCTLLLGACATQSGDDKYYDEAIQNALRTFNYGEKKEALNIVDSVFANKNNISPNIQYKIYNFKRIYYYYLKNNEKSYLYTDSMLAVLEANHAEVNNKVEYANALSAKADNYWDQNIFNKAFEYYFKSRIISESVGDTCALSNVNYHMGMINYRQEKYADAIKLFQQSLAENDHCDKTGLNFYRSQELINNIALAFTHLNEYDSAKHYYYKTLDFLVNDRSKYQGTEDHFLEEAKGVVYGDLAKIYVLTNMPDTAITLLNKSISINLQPDFDKGDAMLDKLQLAELYINTNALDDALKTLADVKSMIDTLKAGMVRKPVLNESRQKYNHLMYRVMQAKNQTADALQYLHNYESVRDSIEAQNRELNTINVQQLLDYKETYHKNELLRRDKKLVQVSLMITIILCLFVLVTGGLIYNNYRKSKLHVNELTMLNQQINEQKSQVEFAVAQLEKNNEEKDRILYMVVHDLRNPVNGIIFLADLLLENDMTGEQRENMEMIMSAAQSCSALINDLLEVSSGKSYDENTKRSIEDVNDLVKYVVNLMQFRTIAKNQQVIFKPSDVPVYVFVNKEKLRRALSNILYNAVKFSPERSSIEVSIARQQKTVTIAIKDKGIGIPQNMQPFVFDMFTTAKRHGTHGEKSFGLGLSICKQIVEANNGKITFVSKEDEGSTFIIALPEID